MVSITQIMDLPIEESLDGLCSALFRMTSEDTFFFTWEVKGYVNC